MDVTGTSALEFENKTPEGLLPPLAESGQVVPAIKVIFDRNWSSLYSTVLSDCAAKKKAEIETICNDNYSDFIDAIDQLLGVQLSVNELQTKINGLNGSIQQNGTDLRDKISKLLLLKQTRRNMDITINKLNRLKYILLLMDKIRDLISKKKYISALKNLNQLTSHHLIQLQEYSITRKIWDYVPSLREQITKQVNSNFDEWMHGIHKQGNALGKLAFEQTKEYLQSLEEKEELDQDERDGNEAELQHRFGLFIGDNNTINENTPNRNLMNETPQKAQHQRRSTLFEKVENLDFNAIYQCIHIHEQLGTIELFVSRYGDIRKRTRLKILSESLVKLDDSTSKKKKKKKKKSIINNDFFYNLCGYYVIEHAVSSRYQQLMNQEQIQSEWDQSCQKLTKRIKNELLTTCKLPTELIDIKNNILILSKAILNYDFKIIHITSFLEELRGGFEKRLVIMLEKNVKKILLKDKFQPFTVQNINDFNCIAAYNLDVVIEDKVTHSSNRGATSNQADDIKDGYDESDFPRTVPFSVSVPMICGYLDDFIAYYENYSQYLSDIAPHIRRSVEHAIKNVICGQLKAVILNSKQDSSSNSNIMNHHTNAKQQRHHAQTSEQQSIDLRNTTIDRRLDIAELAQLAVNALYLERSCTFFESELATEDQINFSDPSNMKDHKEKDKSMEMDEASELIQIPKMHDAREALKSVMSQCVDALFEKLGICVENILNKYMVKINWVSDKFNNNINEWVYKLIEFLDEVLKKKIKYLPAQYRDSAYFIAMARIKQFIITIFTSHSSESIGIKKWNIISMYNFNLDIIRLETYSRQTMVPDLHQIFMSLRQLLDLLLSGKEIVYYLNDEMRMEKYPVVEGQHVRILLDKYKTLGFLNRLPQHIKNLDKRTVQTMLKGLKDID